MKKKLLKLALGPMPISVYATDANCSNYKLVYANDTEGEMFVSVARNKGICMTNLLHEVTEAYFHMMQLVYEPLYLAASFSDRRIFHFDHIQFSEGMVDIGTFVEKVWPLLLSAKEEYDEKKQGKKKNRNKNSNTKR